MWGPCGSFLTTGSFETCTLFGGRGRLQPPVNQLLPGNSKEVQPIDGMSTALGGGGGGLWQQKKFEKCFSSPSAISIQKKARVSAESLAAHPEGMTNTIQSPCPQPPPLDTWTDTSVVTSKKSLSDRTNTNGDTSQPSTPYPPSVFILLHGTCYILSTGMYNLS